MEELALHVLDLIQNSLEAGARHLVLTVVEDRAQGVLTVQLLDDGRGMEAATQQRVFDPFFTSRTTRRVGLGLPLLRATAEATGGLAELASRPGEGTRVQVVVYTRHIDCPPLGDLALTVAVSVAANPQVEFCYTHTVDGRSMEFDTAELRSQLAEVPLSDPAVYQWMLAFLREELSKLYGGAKCNEIPSRS
ncbi:MAG TPA: ATP-binding protein [Clostridiales bacterium UBA8153]|nr:ATP-binding protein [Clostridiales bacterium UBA8153]